MAFASVGTLGSVQDKTAGTTIALPVSANAEVGNVVYVASAWDNAGTSAAETTQLSIADASGNTWIKLGERTYSAGAADDGVVVAQWVSKITTQINSGANITVTSTSSRAASTILGWEFTASGGPLTFGGVVNFDYKVSGGAAGDPAASNLNPGVSREWLWLHALGHEGDPGTVTASTSHTHMGEIETGGGSVTTNIHLCAEFRIATLSTLTVDMTSTGTDRDWAQTNCCVYEGAAGTPHSQPVDDTLAVADSTATQSGKTAAPADTLTLADSQAFQGVFARTIPDTLTLADSQSSQAVFQRVIGDTLTLADSCSPSLGVGGVAWEQPVDDTLTLADGIASQAVFQRSIPDTLTVADTAPAFQAVFQRTVADTLTVADGQTFQAVFARLVADTLAVADVCSPSLGVGGTDWTQPVDDSLSLSDVLAFQRELVQADTLALADLLATERGISWTLADTLSLTDLATTAAGKGATIADTLTLADAVAFQFGVVFPIADTLTVADTLVSQAGFQRLLADTLALADLLSTSALGPVVPGQAAIADSQETRVLVETILEHALNVSDGQTATVAVTDEAGTVATVTAPSGVSVTIEDREA